MEKLTSISSSKGARVLLVYSAENNYRHLQSWDTWWIQNSFALMRRFLPSHVPSNIPTISVIGISMAIKS